MFQPSANLDGTTIIPTHFVKYRQAPWSSLHKTLLRTISKFRKEKENSVDAMPQKKRQFHVVFVRRRQRNIQKSVMHVPRVFVSLIRPVAFSTLPLPSPLSD